MLVIARQTAAVHQPAKGSLHHPALFQDLKAFRLLGAQHDLHHPLASVHHPPQEVVAAKAPIGPNRYQSLNTLGGQGFDPREQGFGPVPFRGTRRRHEYGHHQPQGLDGQKALAPLELFTRVVADGLIDPSGAFHNLTVNHGFRRTFRATLLDAIPLPQAVMTRLGNLRAEKIRGWRSPN